MEFTIGAESEQVAQGPGLLAVAELASAAPGDPALCLRVPPKGHTGAQPTGGAVDWLEVTFKDTPSEEVLQRFTPEGSDLAEWVALPSGRHGYRSGAIRGVVRVYWDGAEGMGVHVCASGEGVRQLEAEGIVGAWEGASGFAARLLVWGARSSRVDVAFDDRKGYLQPERIDGAIREGRCVSRFKRADPRQCIDLKDGSAGGWSVYLGSSQSRARVRFYDKAAEQAEKGCQVDGHWVRCELQARDERADWVLAALAGEGLAAIAGLVFGYVDFKERDDSDSNRSRWSTCSWWLEFLGDVQKRTCTVAQVVKTLEQVAGWFARQIAPSLALLWHARDYGQEWLEEQFAQGSARLKNWQLAALAGAVT